MPDALLLSIHLKPSALLSVCGKTVPLPDGSSISSIDCKIIDEEYRRSQRETCTSATFKSCRGQSGTDRVFSFEYLGFSMSLLFQQSSTIISLTVNNGT